MRTQQLLPLFSPESRVEIRPFRRQLLKWVRNKQRFAHEIAAYFPARFGTYYEPFLGSGAVLGTLAPRSALASDAFFPLIEIWQALKEHPSELKQWYAERWDRLRDRTKEEVYEEVSDFRLHDENLHKNRRPGRDGAVWRATGPQR